MILRGKRGQLTIFILIGIAIIAAGVLFYLFRGNLIQTQIPTSIQPAYNAFLNCLEEDTLTGASILESQAGYIETPDFQPGSAYSPFSNQLDFLGNPVPYWYYVSGNNIQKEQVPTQEEMETQLANYIDERIRNCEFQEFYEDEFEISLGEPETKVSINPNTISLDLDMDLTLTKGEDAITIRNHDASVNSNLGALYESAKKVYDYEQENLFLEEYGIDTLRLYAPVDGVEIQCSPLTWNANEVFDTLENAIEANTQALKNSNDNDYFSESLPVGQEVRFLNSKDWPKTFEVSPSQESLLISNPVGNQPGLGILGFCYVPYHFVYSVKYPVLVQVSESVGGETFQFPIAVVIEGNNPREPLEISAAGFQVPELCEQKNTQIKVTTYDTDFNPVDSEISYECSGTLCRIGNTESGTIEENFPQCVNGFVVAKSEGFLTKKEQLSIVSGGSVDLFLDKLYNMNVQLKLDNSDFNGQATISFISEQNSKTIVYPEQKEVELSEGQYEIQVQIYKDSEITIQETNKEYCTEIPDSGIGGFLGLTKEKCYTVNFPSQVVSSTLAGGGKQNHFILESDLKNSNTIEINAQSFPTPETVEQLQENYILFDEKSLGITIS